MSRWPVDDRQDSPHLRTFEDKVVCYQRASWGGLRRDRKNNRKATFRLVGTHFSSRGRGGSSSGWPVFYGRGRRNCRCYGGILYALHKSVLEFARKSLVYAARCGVGPNPPRRSYSVYYPDGNRKIQASFATDLAGVFRFRRFGLAGRQAGGKDSRALMGRAALTGRASQSGPRLRCPAPDGRRDPAGGRGRSRRRRGGASRGRYRPTRPARPFPRRRTPPACRRARRR